MKGVDTFTRWQGYILAYLIFTLIFITMADITGRQAGYVTMWAFDVEWFHNGALLMLAMGYAVFRDQHVRIDILTSRWSSRTQSIMMAISFGIIIIPVMIFIAINAWDFALHSLSLQEETVMAWHAPLWPIKSCIFVGICLMLPQCFTELIRHIYFIIKKEKL
jgi:TRAP-type mannitol/chloroaromatic compound transport system permease small subunit